MACDSDQTHPSFPPDEKIEAVRIRLHGAAQTMAVLSEFRTADRLLASWLDRSNGAASVDFQVTFCDGFVFCGCYRHRKRKRNRPALSAFVRSSLDALTAAQPAWLPDLSRYSVES